jgi:hypothetical protein
MIISRQCEMPWGDYQVFACRCYFGSEKRFSTRFALCREREFGNHFGTGLNAAPDLAVEIISPSNSFKDRYQKESSIKNLA